MTTFNILNAEERQVAAALFPPQPIPREETCLYVDEQPRVDQQGVITVGQSRRGP